MTCSRARTWLQLYVDGRIEARRLGPLEAHLRGCAACRHELSMLETVCESLSELPTVAEPVGLTNLILARIAAFEVRQAAADVRQFGLRWADALLAALLATMTTLLFVLVDPSLRATVPSLVSHSFPAFVALLTKSGPGSIAWIAWIVWLTVGFGLAFWLAGAEVRSTWRRSVSQHLPQLRQLW